jgi:hypothetical protein
LSDTKSYLIELREERNKQVLFYFLDDTFNLKKIDTQLDWWSGVEALVGNSVVFHGFLQQDLPIHQGIKVWDSEKNEWQWENEFLTFVNVEDAILLAKNSLGSLDTVLKIDLLTGQETSFEPKYKKNNSFVANIVTKDEPYFADIAFFISQYTHLQPTDFLEYLETTAHIIVSYFVKNEKKYDNYLLVTSSGGDELLHICLHEGSKGLAAGTFHVSDALLSFVKDKNELFIVALQ